jgi:Transposase DDE domain group 1
MDASDLITALPHTLARSGPSANAVRLQLHALAYNLANFLRTWATPEPTKDWSLTSLKEKLIKIGAKVVSHGRYVAFQMAEVAIPKILFADIFGSLRNCGRRRSHQPRKAFVRYASEPNSRERCASMTENLAIFNARHGAGSFHPHRQPAPTAQDCLTHGNEANCERPDSYLVNVGLFGLASDGLSGSSL